MHRYVKVHPTVFIHSFAGSEGDELVECISSNVAANAATTMGTSSTVNARGGRILITFLLCFDVIYGGKGERWLTPERNAIGHTHVRFKQT
jgi:hypothetical protein